MQSPTSLASSLCGPRGGVILPPEKSSHLKLQMSFRPEDLAGQLTVDGVHDLKRTVRVLVLETFEDEVHIGCDLLSYGCSGQEGGKYR